MYRQNGGPGQQNQHAEESKKNKKEGQSFIASLKARSFTMLNEKSLQL